MKKQNHRNFLAGALVSLLCVSLIGSATAAVERRTLTADYNDIKITLDGKVLSPKDADGVPVDPFVVDGTTYLPVRAVGEALGLGVDWDGSTHTVILISPDDPDKETHAHLMTYYKVLHDNFDRLHDYFFDYFSTTNGISNLLDEQFRTADGVQAATLFLGKLEDDLESFEVYYNANRDHLSDDGIVLAGEYRRLANKCISNFKTVIGPHSNAQIDTITRTSPTDGLECTGNAQKADAGFWASYANIF